MDVNSISAISLYVVVSDSCSSVIDLRRFFSMIVRVLSLSEGIHAKLLFLRYKNKSIKGFCFDVEKIK